MKKYPENKDYKEEMFIILSQTGAVIGEYGFVENYEKKKEEIQEWKKDLHKSIQKFTREYEDYLSQQINERRKRSR